MKKALIFALVVGLAVWLSMSIAWWFFVLPALAGGFFLRNERRSFLLGFLTIGLLFAVMLLATSKANDGLLLARIGAMFQQSPTVIMLLSIVLPSLLGGLASWSGALLRSFCQENVKSPPDGTDIQN